MLLFVLGHLIGMQCKCKLVRLRLQKRFDHLRHTVHCTVIRCTHKLIRMADTRDWRQFVIMLHGKIKAEFLSFSISHSRKFKSDKKNIFCDQSSRQVRQFMVICKNDDCIVTATSKQFTAITVIIQQRRGPRQGSDQWVMTSFNIDSPTGNIKTSPPSVTGAIVECSLDTSVSEDDGDSTPLLSVCT